MTTSDRVLDVRALSVGYGKAQVIDRIDLHVDRGESLAVVGPNGAGKTTLLRALSRLMPSSAETLELEGSPLPKSPYAVVMAGLVHCPRAAPAVPRALDPRQPRARCAPAAHAALDQGRGPAARFPRCSPKLEERASQSAGTLSGGRAAAVRDRPGAHGPPGAAAARRADARALGRRQGVDRRRRAVDQGLGHHHAAGRAGRQLRLPLLRPRRRARARGRWPARGRPPRSPPTRTSSRPTWASLEHSPPGGAPMSLSVATILAESAVRHADRTAVVLGELKLTYAQLWAHSLQYASVLREKGVGPGDRVALLLPNTPHFPLAYYGTLALGAVAVPVHALLKAEEIQYVLEDSGAKVLVCAAPLLGEGAKGGRAGGRPGPGGHGWRRRHRRADRQPRARGHADRGDGADRGRGHRGDPLHQRHDRHPQGRPDHPPERDDERRGVGDAQLRHRRDRCRCSAACRCSTPSVRPAA